MNTTNYNPPTVEEMSIIIDFFKKEYAEYKICVNKLYSNQSDGVSAFDVDLDDIGFLAGLAVGFRVKISKGIIIEKTTTSVSMG